MWRVVAASAMAYLILSGPAGAQAPPVRLAAAADCQRNPNCAPGLRRVYHVDPSGSLVRLKVADAGVRALDDGLAEVAVAFTSNPQVSRPDIVTLRDDRRMITPDHVVPVVRASLLKRYGPALRRQVDAASRLLTTLQLRALNQQVIDGRLPEAVGGDFVDANGLGGRPAHLRPGPRIVVGFQDFAENETLAHLYAEVLRSGGFRVTVRKAGGLRPQTVAALRRGRIGLYPGYSGSLLGYLGGTSLKRALGRIGAQPLALAPAQDRNSFVMKTDVARALGVSRLSDLARFWPAASAARAAAPAAPDLRQGEQWAVAAGSVLDLQGAWNLAQGQGVTVAVVDSGTRLDHPDLAPNVWTNFGEIPGNGVDDDNNGLIDDVHGADFTTTAAGQDLSDANGHGTHVAGIIAAAANGRGVVGIAPRAKIMTLRVMDSEGRGTTGGVADAVRYAAANGARIINLSLRSDAPDPRVDEAIAAANAANALVVVAAGNDGRDIDQQPSYPASIPAPNLVAVAATSPEDGRGIASFSNFGALTVQLAAPGEEILSTYNDGGYAYESGTSMAAPMASGVAALMASANPRLSASDLRALLLQHAVRSRLPVAAGYLDALESVRAAALTVPYDATQAPRVKVLQATAKGGRTKIQVGLLGATAAVRRCTIAIDRKRVAQVTVRVSPFTVTLARGGRRVRVTALADSGRPLASAQRAIRTLRPGKRHSSSGGAVGT